MRIYTLLLLICLPLRFIQVTSPYGFRIHPVTHKYSFHNGVDMKAEHDTVFAIADGRVADCAYNGLPGIYIELDHGYWQSVYGHLAYLLVAKGDSVYAGSPIAISGETGRVTGPHLHFAIRIRGKPVDPLKFIYERLIQTEHE